MIYIPGITLNEIHDNRMVDNGTPGNNYDNCMAIGITVASCRVNMTIILC